MKPFAKSRTITSPTASSTEACTCQTCNFSDRLSGERPHTGYCLFTPKRLDFRREESLADTRKAIREHYEMVAHELQQPFTMGFRGS